MNRYLVEWLNENMNRMYPFSAAVTGYSNIPTQLFTDAFFFTSSNIEAVYLSKISKGEYGYYLYFKAKDTEDNVIDFSEYPIFLSEDLTYGSEVDITLFSDGSALISNNISSYISGSIFIGKIGSLKTYPAIIENPDPNNETGLMFFPGIVREESLGVTGITVNNKTYTGNVVINCGEGIEAVVTGEETTDGTDTYVAGATITFNVIEYAPPSDNLVITKDTDILANLAPNPVLSINGEYPDDNGNISFVAHATPQYGVCGEQCVSIAAMALGNGTIQFYATIDDNLDCDEDTSFVNMLENLSTLRGDVAELNTKVTALDSQLSTISKTLEK